MRKGYGPTGVSFHYTFEAFMTDLRLCRVNKRPLQVETVIDGNTFTTEFSPDMTESEARVLFDKLDNVTLADGLKLFQLFA
jgi:hypothetical protein